MYEWSSVKHESQRRVRSLVSPVRSVVSSTVEQKQVGQTIVQLPQLRQRSATASQRGCSALACTSARSRAVSRLPPIEAAAPATAASADSVSAGVADALGSAASSSPPR